MGETLLSHVFLSVLNVDAFGGDGYRAALQVVVLLGGSRTAGLALDVLDARSLVVAQTEELDTVAGQMTPEIELTPRTGCA